ncbi:MAG: WGxxGxxG family protein [Bacteroidota bacterium]
MDIDSNFLNLKNYNMKKLANLMSPIILCLLLICSYPSIAQNADSSARMHTTTTTESREDHDDYGKWGLAGLLGLLGLLGLRKRDDVIVTNRSTSTQPRP